ncbi:GNAT family N-acetyltransferase [Streptomyces sp. NPDC051909]|uniref:GNAT family N-acetyltransferase n=1 Tax=Streptomyces sp. NPDC051909 TaxID=3154944 RepID=UPI00342640B9
MRRVLEEIGTEYRLFGEASLISSLVQQIPNLTPIRNIVWMDATTSLPELGTPRAQWLNDQHAKGIQSLFTNFFPDSYAQPGCSGVDRWAGVLAGAADPMPLAVAADAWSSAGCGFLAGVITHPSARGRGLAQLVCRFVVDSLISQYGRAALMVHADNDPAIAAYERIGMRKRPFLAAHVACSS